MATKQDLNRAGEQPHRCSKQQDTDTVHTLGPNNTCPNPNMEVILRKQLPAGIKHLSREEEAMIITTNNSRSLLSNNNSKPPPVKETLQEGTTTLLNQLKLPPIPSRGMDKMGMVVIMPLSQVILSSSLITIISSHNKRVVMGAPQKGAMMLPAMELKETPIRLRHLLVNLDTTILKQGMVTLPQLSLGTV